MAVSAVAQRIEDRAPLRDTPCLHSTDWSAWMLVEAAIAIRARRLCAAGCSKAIDGAACHTCAAQRFNPWRQEAITALKRDTVMREAADHG